MVGIKVRNQGQGPGENLIRSRRSQPDAENARDAAGRRIRPIDELFRRRHPDTIRRREFHTGDFSADLHALQAGLFDGLRKKTQNVLIAQGLLYRIQIRSAAHRSLKSEKVRFAAGILRQL